MNFKIGDYVLEKESKRHICQRIGKIIQAYPVHDDTKLYAISWSFPQNQSGLLDQTELEELVEVISEDLFDALSSSYHELKFATMSEFNKFMSTQTVVDKIISLSPIQKLDYTWLLNPSQKPDNSYTWVFVYYGLPIRGSQIRIIDEYKKSGRAYPESEE